MKIRALVCLACVYAMTSTSGCLLFAVSSDAGPDTDAGDGDSDGGARDDGGVRDDGGLGPDVDAGPINTLCATQEDISGVVLEMLCLDFDVNTRVMLEGDSIAFTITAPNGETLPNIVQTDTTVTGFEIVGLVGTPTELSAQLLLTDVDLALDQDDNTFEAEKDVSLLFTPDAGAAFSFTIELLGIHRAHGPFVDHNAAEMSPCGHPQRPCNNIIAANEHFNLRMAEADDLRWEAERYLRLSQTSSGQHIVETSDANGVIPMTSIGIRGGYTVPSAPSNDDWQTPDASLVRSDLQLLGGASLELIEDSTHPSSETFSDINIVGESGSPLGGYVAVRISRDVNFTNMRVTGHLPTGNSYLIDREIVALEVGLDGSLDATDSVTIIGYDGSSVTSTIQDNGNGDVIALRSFGTLDFNGTATGASGEDAIGALANDIDESARTVGILIEFGTATITGNAVGGHAPSPIGLSVIGGTLITSETTQATGGTSTIFAANPGDTLGQAAGLFLEGAPNVPLLEGIFIGGSAKDYAAGIRVSTTGGTFSVEDAVARARDTGDLARVAIGFDVQANGAIEIDRLLAFANGLGSVGARINSSSAALVVTRTAGSTTSPNIVALTTPGDAAGIHKGVLVGNGVQVDLDIDATVAAGGQIATGFHNRGIFNGGLTIAVGVTNANQLDSTGEVQGVLCGQANYNGNAPAFGGPTMTVRHLSNFEPANGKGSTIDVSNSTASSVGFNASYRCDATIEASILAQGPDIVNGLAIVNATVRLNSSTVTAQVVSPSATNSVRAVDMRCSGNTTLTATDSEFHLSSANGGLAGNTMTQAHGIFVGPLDSPNGGNPPACSKSHLELDGGRAIVSAAGVLTNGITASTPGTDPVVVISNMEIVVNAIRGNEVRDEINGIHIDATNALIKLDSNSILVNAPDNGTQYWGARLSLNGRPQEVHLWNNFVEVLSNNSGGAAMEFEVLDTVLAGRVNLDIVLLYNTLSSPGGTGGRALAASLPSNDSDVEWHLAKLVGNFIVGNNNGTAIWEDCEDSDRYAVFDGEQDGPNFVSAQRSDLYFRGYDLDSSCTFQTDFPERYDAPSTGMFGTDRDGCSNSLPSDVKEVALEMISPSDPVFFGPLPITDYDGLERQFDTNAGRCQN